MSTNTDNSDETERGPNGFPFIDGDRTRLSQWESGEYHLKVARSDGELISVNLKPEQFGALRDMVEDMAERSDFVRESDGGSDA